MKKTIRSEPFEFKNEEARAYLPKGLINIKICIWKYPTFIIFGYEDENYKVRENEKEEYILKKIGKYRGLDLEAEEKKLIEKGYIFLNSYKTLLQVESKIFYKKNVS